MHSTRRLLERRLRHGLTCFAYGLATTACLVATATSCSSSNDAPNVESDAGDDVAVAPTDDAATTEVDAGIDVIHRDPVPFDGGPLPVVCTSPPCATALVTTLALNDSDHGEGYCALLSDGTVACWGANGAGQLGRGSDFVGDTPYAARVEGVANVRQLDHTCALDGDGMAWCWGTGPHLVGGSGAITTDRTAVKLPLENVSALGIGPTVGCAVVDSGVVCWGRNTYGQLAPFTRSTDTDQLGPTAIELPSTTPVRRLVVSKAVFALHTDGTVSSWGANPPLARVSSLFPDPYPTLTALAGVASLGSVHESGCATAAGIGYWWGDIKESLFQDYYENAPRVDRALPEAVAAPEPLVSMDTTRAFITKIPLVSLHELPQRWCAVGASGDVYCWGFNENGQAGDGTKVNVLADPVKVQGLPAPAADVKTTPTATCVLLTTGKVMCWGSNYYGQLGVGPYKAPSLVPQEVALP